MQAFAKQFSADGAETPAYPHSTKNEFGPIFSHHLKELTQFSYT